MLRVFSFQHEIAITWNTLYECYIIIVDSNRDMFTGCAFLDISPNYSSSLNTLGNTMGALAGLSSPIVVAALVSGTL